MELPSALQRMLESALQFDELKNWSIYQENDGKYTFKIRFVPRNVSHIDSPEPALVEANHMKSFKQKSVKQLSRDNKRAAEHRRRQPQRTCKNDEVSRELEKCNEVFREAIESCERICDRHLTPPIVSPVNVAIKPKESPVEESRHHSFCLDAEAEVFQPSSIVMPLSRPVYPIGDVDPPVRHTYEPQPADKPPVTPSKAGFESKTSSESNETLSPPKNVRFARFKPLPSFWD